MKMLEGFNESELPEAIRNRLSELRACDNVASLTVQSESSSGVLCILVPTDHVADGNGWAMPTEPQLLLIPNKAH